MLALIAKSPVHFITIYGTLSYFNTIHFQLITTDFVYHCALKKKSPHESDFGISARLNFHQILAQNCNTVFLFSIGDTNFSIIVAKSCVHVDELSEEVYCSGKLRHIVEFSHEDTLTLSCRATARPMLIFDLRSYTDVLAITTQHKCLSSIGLTLSLPQSWSASSYRSIFHVFLHL